MCVEDMVGEVIVPPARKLEDLIRLADLCVDLLRQNEEFYAEVSRNSCCQKPAFAASTFEMAVCACAGNCLLDSVFFRKFFI